MANGARISVAAGAGADAGSISVSAVGNADIEAQLNGAGSLGTRPGSFTLQAGSLTNFAGLNNVLEQSGFHTSDPLRSAAVTWT